MNDQVRTCMKTLCNKIGYKFQSIHDLSLSPDGSVLATVSEDGHLKFWQVNWEKDEKNEQPK